MGNDGLIDDFNDNNPEIRLVDGRLGNWATYKSATSMVTNQMLEGVPEFPLVVMGMGMMNRGLRFRGTEPLETSQWAGEVVATVTPDCYDASIYRGVQLQIRGLPNTRAEVMLLTASVRAQNMPDQIGGHYHFPVTITSATAFQTVTILWNQFLPGWGVTPGPNVDPKLVYGLAVLPALRPAANDAGTATSIGQFDFTIDNVRFLAPMP